MAFEIGDEQARWILEGGATITIASCDAERRPSLGQGLGCRIEGGTRVTIFLAAGRSAELLADVRAGRAVAVVITSSFTTRSLQIKARGAREVPLEPGDSDRISAYVGAVSSEWAGYGVADAFTRALLAREPGPIVAIEVVPEIAFDQTPGPGAGRPLA